MKHDAAATCAAAAATCISIKDSSSIMHKAMMQNRNKWQQQLQQRQGQQ